MKVERIINTIYASNTYILYDPRYDEVWLVDAGDTNLVIEWIEKYSKTLKGVFLTHTHFDHIYGLNTLYQHYPDIRVFTSPEGAEGLYSEKWNFSKYHHCSFVYAGNNVDIVRNKQTVDLWPDVRLHIIKTPGHDWSCLTFEVTDCLFTGDDYIPGKKVVTTFPKSNRSEAIKSVEIILNLPGIMKIFPGHGNVEIVNH